MWRVAGRVAGFVAFCATMLWLCCHPASAQSGYGEVSFANSGAAAAQPDFLLGLAQLHDFEYDDATAHFQKAEQLNPGFAMAYWGEAMTKNHPVWHEQDLAAAREVLGRLGSTPETRVAKAPTRREKAYLQTIEILYGDGTKEERDQKYEAAMADLHREFPDDVDATAFYALSILGSAENGRDFAIYMRAAAVLEEVFPTHLRHPGVVHYLIHCYDDPIHAPLGLRAARIYAQIAPNAGHAQHMTSHIFLALGMWDDVVKANETAIAIVNRNRRKDGKPDEACGHYDNWLEYGYLQIGRTEDARRVLNACREEAFQGVSQPGAKGAMYSSAGSVNSYAEMRTDFLINTQLWNDPVARWTIPQGEYPAAQLTFDYGTELAALERHDLPAYLATASALQTDRDLVRKWNAERKTEGSTEQNERAQIIVQQVNALILFKGGQAESAVAELREAAEKEHSLPMDFGPPFVNKPTDELLGEMLLQLARHDDARAAFQTALSRTPGRRISEAGLSEADVLPATSATKPSNQQGAAALTIIPAHNH
jgi:tetratricopeptide (TPR) repeat protein